MVFNLFIFSHFSFFNFYFILFFFLVFVVDPVSVAAVEGSLASFSCIARNVEQISYRVNETTATDKNVVDNGFVQQSDENLGNALRRRNLTVTVSSNHNNTEIYCRGIGTDMNVNSKIITLTVQGKEVMLIKYMCMYNYELLLFGVMMSI